MDQKKVKRIWILNHYANGNGDRHDAFANKLKDLGLEVFVIASSYHHSEHRYINEDKCFIQNRNDGLRYAWLHTTPAYYGNGFNRILNMVSYMRMVKHYSMEWCVDYGKPDVVIGSSVHPFAWEAAYWISKKTDAVYYTEVRDLWPLSLIEVQGVNPRHPLVSLFGVLEKRAYRRAKKIITTMPYAYRYISDTLGFPKDKVEWIPNGIDITKVDGSLNSSEFTLPNELNTYLEENWCAVYTGSLVESECIDYILDAAKILQDRGVILIKFAIVGGGHLKNELVEESQKQELKNIKFFDRISKEQVANVVKKAKVCLAAVRNLPIYKYGLSMNKLSDYLYSGNPTIFVCDVDNAVKISGGGITLPFGNRELFADTIERVYYMSEDEKKNMADRGRQTIKKQYDTAILAKQLFSIFESNSKDTN